MKKYRYCLLIITIFLPTPLLAANFFGEMMAMMMRMMLIMSNSMAMSSGAGTNMGFGGAMSPNFSTFQNMNAYPNWTQSPLDTNPWSSPSMIAPGYLADTLPQLHGQENPLQGQWISPAGDKLEVNNVLFRLEHGNRAISGQLKISQNIVIMIPGSGSYPTRYRFERRDNALALQTQGGKIMYFRKIP